MKRIDWRALSAAGLTLALCAACGLYPSVASRLAAAQADESGGDYKGAATQLEAVLRRDPNNAPAFVSLTRVDLKLGDAAAAQSDLKRALAAGAGTEELRDLTGDVLWARRQYTDVLKWASAAGASLNAHNLALQARAEVALKDYAAAEQTLTQAPQPLANDPQVLLSLAQLRTAQGRSDQALSVLDRAVATDPGFAPGWLLRGALLMSSAKYADAQAAFKHVTDLARCHPTVPEELQALTGQAEAQLSQADLPSAEDTIKRLSSRYGSSVSSHYLRGRLDLLRGNAEAAVNEFRSTTNAAPDNVAFKVLLGEALLAQGSQEQALATLSEVVSQNPADRNARNLLARAQLASNEPEEARRTLMEAPDSGSPDTQADLLMALSLTKLGDVRGSVPFLERRLDAVPTDKPARIELTRAYLRIGQFDKARTLLDQLPPNARDTNTKNLAVLAQIGAKRGPDAARELDELVKRNPADADLLAFAGAYALNSADGLSASRYFTLSLQQQPDNIIAQLGMASVAVQNADFKTAMDHLQTILQRDPKQPQAMLTMAGVALRQGNTDDARQWFEKAIASQPSAVEARLNLAQLELRSGNAGRGTALLDQAVTVAQDKAAVTNAVGEIELNAGLKKEALEHFNAAAKLENRDAAINVARSQLALGLTAAAYQTLSAIKEAPYAARAGMMLVELDARSGKLAEARLRIANLQKNGLAPATVNELLGDVSWFGKQFAAAENSYNLAYTAMPSQSVAIKLFSVRRAQQAADPQINLERWLDHSPADTRVRRLLADYLQYTGKLPAAITEYQTVLRAASRADPAVLNNLAWTYYQIGDARAFETAKQAYAADPHRAEIADTYGWLLLESGKLPEGKEILERAAVRAPNNPELTYHLAAARARSGDSAAAIASLRSLLGSGQAFEDRHAAEQLLKSLSAT